MLHMLVNTHNPESCAFRSEEAEAALQPALEQLGPACESREAKLQSWWVNTGSHTFFILLDAPNAHVIDEILREAGLTGLTDTTVYAVGDLGRLMEETRQA